MKYPERIVLAGFMGTGKSAVGQALAKKIKYQFIDTDQLIEKLSKKPIQKIFDQDGEAVFRRWERQALDLALAKKQAVIAVGGGAVCSRRNLHKVQQKSTPILLKADLSTLLKRIAKESHRPLLQVKDQDAKIRELLRQRAPFYDQITWQVPTNGATPTKLAGEIAQRIPLEQSALQVKLGERSYPIYFSAKGLKSLGGLLKGYFSGDRVVLITNNKLDRPYGIPLKRELEKFFQVKKIILPDGERFKTLATVQKIYAKLTEFKVDRKTPLIALGGGVVGDMVGYAAATFLRGVPFVQVPTTLLAQVDSSIGGKTGVDLPQGKNLVGAFYQPKFVLIDEEVLLTLPQRQLNCGMAEVIKYAAAFDSKLFAVLEKQIEQLIEGRGIGMEAVIRRCCEIKGEVVEKDEKETLGIRSKLNFGHTLGHAIESLTSYKKFTHGEAIAMGMAFAAEKSVEKTGLPIKQAMRLMELLQRAGLPTQWPNLGKSRYQKALTQDKKRVSTLLHFVYLKKIGQSVVIPTPIEEIL